LDVLAVDTIGRFSEPILAIFRSKCIKVRSNGRERFGEGFKGTVGEKVLTTKVFTFLGWSVFYCLRSFPPRTSRGRFYFPFVIEGGFPN